MQNSPSMLNPSDIKPSTINHHGQETRDDAKLTKQGNPAKQQTHHDAEDRASRNPDPRHEDPEMANSASTLNPRRWPRRSRYSEP